MNKNQLIFLIIIVAILLLASLVYFIIRLRNIKKRIIIITVYLNIFIFLLIVFSFYTVFGNYDMRGIRYANYTEIIFYTREGNKYVLTGEYIEDTKFVNIENQNDYHSEKESLIDNAGYLFFNDKYVLNENNPSLVILSSGEKAHRASFVIWNWLGHIK